MGIPENVHLIMNGLGNPILLTSMALSAVSLTKNKNFIQNNWKPILGIGATLGASYVVWSIYSDWKKNQGNSSTKDLELKEDQRFEKSSLTEAAALSIANRLQDAMGTWRMANEEERSIIKSLLSGLSYNDFVKVSKLFGQRGYVTITGISKDSDFLAAKKNLSYWLSKELPPEDFEVLKSTFSGNL